MKHSGREKIHLTFSFNSKFFAPACVAIKSAVTANCGMDDFVVHVLHTDFTNEEIRALRDIMSDCPNAELNFVPVSWKDLPDVPLSGLPVMYATLFLDQVLDAPRVIYIDADMLVCGDLRELWETPFNGNAILAAAAHFWNPPGTFRELIRFTERDLLDYPYFNAGMVVIDLPAFRTSHDKVWDALSRHYFWKPGYDQAILNVVFRGRIGELPRRWNHSVLVRGSHRADIIHYQAPNRPWQYNSNRTAYRQWWRFFLTHVASKTSLSAIVELSKLRGKLPPDPADVAQRKKRRERIKAAIARAFGQVRHGLRRLQGAKKRVMLYKSHSDNIGDMILLTGVFPHYRTLFKDATLELTCKDASVPMMRALGVFDAVWPRSLLSEKGKPVRTNSGRTDVFVSLRRTPSADDVVWMNSFQPAKNAAFSGDLLMYRVRPDYTKLLDWNCELPDDLGESTMHELETQQKMLATLGCDVTLEDLRPALPETFADVSVADAMAYNFDLSQTPLYVCCPCGSQPIRSYSPKNWRAVFANLAPCVVAICGTDKDWELALEVSAQPVPGVTFVNLVAQTTLPQLAGLMLRANAVLTVDSAPMHMAIALKRPTVAVCGLGHYGRFVPYPYEIPSVQFLFGNCCHGHKGCGWKCPDASAPCINDICPNEVVSALKEVVSK